MLNDCDVLCITNVWQFEEEKITWIGPRQPQNDIMINLQSLSYEYLNELNFSNWMLYYNSSKCEFRIELLIFFCVVYMSQLQNIIWGEVSKPLMIRIKCLVLSWSVVLTKCIIKGLLTSRLIRYLSECRSSCDTTHFNYMPTNSI